MPGCGPRAGSRPAGARGARQGLGAGRPGVPAVGHCRRRPPAVRCNGTKTKEPPSKAAAGPGKILFLSASAEAHTPLQCGGSG